MILTYRYRIKDSEMGDKADWEHCLAIYGPSLARCAGDRLIVSGYVCPHCGSTSPRDECKKPARKARQRALAQPVTNG